MWDKITISGFADEIDESLEKQIAALEKLGICHVEMRGVNGRGLVEYPVCEAREIKKRLDAAGIALSSLGSPVGKIAITEAFEPHMELFRHTVELAHVMGTENIRVFSFYMVEGEPWERHREKVMEQMGRFAEYARAEDVVLLHENEKGIYGDTAPRCLELMENFYGSHFKAVFDFANFVQCGQDTLEAYEMLKPYIAYIHVKDALAGDGSVVPAGTGDGHVEQILKMLKAGGYGGYLSLEPHLGDFAGFAELEQGTGNSQQSIREHPGAALLRAAGRDPREMNGEERFTLALRALEQILDRL